MLIPSNSDDLAYLSASLSRRVNANSQPVEPFRISTDKLIKKGEC